MQDSGRTQRDMLWMLEYSHLLAIVSSNERWELVWHAVGRQRNGWVTMHQGVEEDGRGTTRLRDMPSRYYAFQLWVSPFGTHFLYYMRTPSFMIFFLLHSAWVQWQQTSWSYLRSIWAYLVNRIASLLVSPCSVFLRMSTQPSYATSFRLPGFAYLNVMPVRNDTWFILYSVFGHSSLFAKQRSKNCTASMPEAGMRMHSKWGMGSQSDTTNINLDDCQDEPLGWAETDSGMMSSCRLLSGNLSLSSRNQYKNFHAYPTGEHIC